MPTKNKWRVAKPCADCPFNSEGPGLTLRKSLRRGRWAEILRGLRNNLHFYCHKTTEETGNDTNLVCAGSLEWSEKHGVSTNYQRVCESLDYFRSQREKPLDTEDA